MKRVRFLKAHRMYQPGEEAGFEIGVANGLIASGHAIDPVAAKAAEVAAQAEADAKAAEAAAQAEADAKAAEAAAQAEADAKAAEAAAQAEADAKTAKVMPGKPSK
jgi:hypothetical protein